MDLALDTERHVLLNEVLELLKAVGQLVLVEVQLIELVSSRALVRLEGCQINLSRL